MVTEAVKYNISNNAMSVNGHIEENLTDLCIGAAKGEFSVPDDIDKYNAEIADLVIETERTEI